jgi:hypothetical protein
MAQIEYLASEQPLEQLEVGVELAAAVVAEPSSRFAGSETEGGGVDETFGLREPRLNVDYARCAAW